MIPLELPAPKLKEKILMNLDDLGERIKKVREEKELTQEDLDELTGLHYTYISKIEAGKKQPSLKSLEKITEALGVSLSQLFKEKQDTAIKSSFDKLLKIFENRTSSEINLIIELAETIFPKINGRLKQRGKYLRKRGK